MNEKMYRTGWWRASRQWLEDPAIVVKYVTSDCVGCFIRWIVSDKEIVQYRIELDKARPSVTQAQIDHEVDKVLAAIARDYVIFEPEQNHIRRRVHYEFLGSFRAALEVSA